jgi:hypothetical protein
MSEEAIKEAAAEAAPGAQIVRSDGDFLVYYSGFNLSKFVRFLALRAQSDVRAHTIDDVPSCGQENDYRRSTPDVRAPAPQGEPIANGPLLKAAVDWTYLYATEGRAWPSSKTIAALIAKAMRANPTQADAEAMMNAAPPPPADLTDVLENVRKGIESLGRKRHTGIEVPIELHKACQALTHMVKDSQS